MNQMTSGVMAGTQMTEAQFLAWCEQHLPGMQRAARDGCPSLKSTVQRIVAKRDEIKARILEVARWEGRVANHPYLSEAKVHLSANGPDGGIDLPLQIGERVRSYDFDHRTDCYVEGTITAFKPGRVLIDVDRRFGPEGEEVVHRPWIVAPPVNGLQGWLGLTHFIDRSILPVRAPAPGGNLGTVYKGRMP
jgi:hypothetical protein